MHPVFSLWGAEIHAYALFTVIGAVTAVFLALPALKRAGMTVFQRWAALILMTVCFLVGARLWNVVANPDAFLGSLKWYTPKLAGLSLYGGLAGAAAGLAVFVKICRLRLLPVLDAMVVPAGVAFCIARIGCFLNGCCGGKVTDLPFGVRFPDSASGDNILSGLLPFIKNRAVHPTQLYELAGAAIGLAAVLIICKRIGAGPGSRFMLYAAFFSAVRLIVLPLRALSYPWFIKDIIYPVMYVAIIAAGVIWTIIKNRPAERAGRK